jgi:predicted kinase
MPETAAYIFIGPAGSGKSTAAQRAARLLGAAYLDKDTLVTPLTELLLSERNEDPLQRESSAYYREFVFPAEYRALLATASANLDLGMPVVIDAPFFSVLDDPGYLERARVEAGWPPTHVVVVEVRASDEVMHRRLQARGLPRDTWKLAHWDEFRSMTRNIRCAWRGAELVTLDNESDRIDDANLMRVLSPSRAP